MFTRPVDMCEHVVLYPPSIPPGDKAWIFRAKFMNLFSTPPELNFANKRIAEATTQLFLPGALPNCSYSGFSANDAGHVFSIPKEAPNENGGYKVKPKYALSEYCKLPCFI